MPDLNSMSLEDLKQLSRDVEKAIKTHKERQRQAALAEVEALAREKGFSLTELARMVGKKSKSAVPPKYVNPENPMQTWSGRGRRPKWLDGALQSGKSLDDLAISG